MKSEYNQGIKRKVAEYNVQCPSPTRLTHTTDALRSAGLQPDLLPAPNHTVETTVCDKTLVGGAVC